MIKICIADNQPVVLLGIMSYFKDNPKIDVPLKATSFEELNILLNTHKADIIILDLELSGVLSIKDIKKLVAQNPDSKIILYTTVPEKMYASNAIKAGVYAYVEKTTSLHELERIIVKVNNGEKVYSEEVKKKIDLLSKGNKTDRLHKKLSTREIEVLRYLNDGKKNKEIAQILGLDEKTISTYKLRLLAKLSVSNLIDLLAKAKTLDII
ncbi:LuxR C-terminal-related transcriptional regulator [Flavobacterium sp.]|uniref:LuxR C-terminal-related transcriptional regulator n=1 Tax=Flavobacterium sp. TaxID=239 RepID=UPI003528A3FC